MNGPGRTRIAPWCYSNPGMGFPPRHHPASPAPPTTKTPCTSPCATWCRTRTAWSCTECGGERRHGAGLSGCLRRDRGKHPQRLRLSGRQLRFSYRGRGLPRLGRQAGRRADLCCEHRRRQLELWMATSLAGNRNRSREDRATALQHRCQKNRHRRRLGRVGRNRRAELRRLQRRRSGADQGLIRISSRRIIRRPPLRRASAAVPQRAATPKHRSSPRCVRLNRISESPRHLLVKGTS